MSESLPLAQMLCTRLCHDLAGPVGAVSAGVELMGSDPTLVDDETLSLLSGSADAASRKLKFLRIAFGWVGSGTPPLDQVGIMFEDYLVAITGPSGGPATHWPDMADLISIQSRLGDQSAQVIANLALAGLELQPRCKTLTVTVERDEKGLRLVIANKTSDGDVRVRDDIAAEIRGNGNGSLTPQTVQAHLTGRLIGESGGRFEYAVVGDGVITTAGWN